ncbi:alpha/beta fold hydrolase [Rhodoblastus acidophilus]|uniref:Alpha/beta fold hydrolase n=1 Tax=Rhodoblastus acidophilus TaxID=1074 RepID=A0A6N8DHY7_RHOAC|nr:alpha/beta fold hydrolase [Rhodoblastus acidophilus]MCW2273143.1 pimeloyl-ACP methyl ester carboxylesterase [Rhodoblastus acidophilus]MTV30040.1 alpha/beta fold hydrolase [Rhodoblastus acidophilus]
MRTLLLRSAVVLILIVAAIAGHLTRLLFGFEAGLIVLLLVFVGLPAAIPSAAIAMNAPNFLNIGAPERRWLASAAEVYAFWRAFVVLMPFDTFWMGDEKVLPHAPDETPIVLVPGYCCNRGMWFEMARDLEAAGRKVAPLTLGWTFADIDELADELDQHIARVKEQTGAEKVLLVGHSKGGLVARARIARRGGDDVVGLVTLATPHHGTSFAKYGYGRSARQMEPDSPWLQALNAKETPVPVHAFWAGRDEFVSPPDAARLQGAPETCAPLAGHMSVIAQPEVLKKILAFSEPAAKGVPSAALNPQPEPPAPIVVVAPVEAAPAVAETPVVVVAPPAAADQVTAEAPPAPAQEQPVAGA